MREKVEKRESKRRKKIMKINFRRVNKWQQILFNFIHGNVPRLPVVWGGSARVHHSVQLFFPSRGLLCSRDSPLTPRSSPLPPAVSNGSTKGDECKQAKPKFSLHNVHCLRLIWGVWMRIEPSDVFEATRREFHKWKVYMSTAMGIWNEEPEEKRVWMRRKFLLY